MSSKPHKNKKTPSFDDPKPRRQRGMKPKTYRFHATCLITHEGYVEVEAFSEEEAWEEAEDLEFVWESTDEINSFEIQYAYQFPEVGG